MGRAGSVHSLEEFILLIIPGEHRCKVEEKDESSWMVCVGGDQDNRIDGQGWKYVVGGMGYPEVLRFLTSVICINTLFSLISGLTLISSS